MYPKVSIIFTSYNHREYLKKALDSLLIQTFTDFELIIIDDCSTDGSQEVLCQYKTDARVKLYLLEKNTGSYVHSSNFGASMAIADYIIFAQCDDFAESNQLERLYTSMTTNPSAGVAFSSSTMIDKDGKNLGNDFKYREKLFKNNCSSDILIESKKMRRFLLSSCVIPNLSAALIKRSLFNKQGGFNRDYLVLADWDFWLKTALETNFYYIREPLNNFRQHSSTIRATINIKRQIGEIFKMYYDFFKLSKINIFDRIRWEFNVMMIWYGYFRSAKVFWIKSIFPLLMLSVKYSFLYPLMFAQNLFIYPCFAITRKIINYKN